MSMTHAISTGYVAVFYVMATSEQLHETARVWSSTEEKDGQ